MDADRRLEQDEGCLPANVGSLVPGQLKRYLVKKFAYGRAIVLQGLERVDH